MNLREFKTIWYFYFQLDLISPTIRLVLTLPMFCEVTLQKDKKVPVKLTSY